jgi:hypothetical protein
MNKRLTEELRNTQGVMTEIESIYTGFYNIPGRTNGQHLQVFRSLKNNKPYSYYDSSNKEKNWFFILIAAIRFIIRTVWEARHTLRTMEGL